MFESRGPAIGNRGLGQEGWSWAEKGLGWTAGQAPDPASFILSTPPSIVLGVLLKTWTNKGVEGGVIYIVCKVAGPTGVICIICKVAGEADVTCFIFRVVGGPDVNHTELCEWMASKSVCRYGFIPRGPSL